MSQKEVHALDLKLPLGGLLTLYGVILVLAGLFTNDASLPYSSGYNVNLWWGILLLLVGAVFITVHIIKNRR